MSDPGRLAWLEREVATRSRLVHERDALAEVSARTRAELTALQMRARHSHSVTCDRCGSTLAVTSSMAIGDDVSTEALVVLTGRSGWRLSLTTLAGLGVLASSSASAISDLCPACAVL